MRTLAATSRWALYKSVAGKGFWDLGKYSARQLATCVWALSVLQQQSNLLFQLFWAELHSRPKESFMYKTPLMQLHQVSICVCTYMALVQSGKQMFR